MSEVPRVTSRLAMSLDGQGSRMSTVAMSATSAQTWHAELVRDTTSITGEYLRRHPDR